MTIKEGGILNTFSIDENFLKKWGITFSIDENFLKKWGCSGHESQKIKKYPNHNSRKLRQRLKIGN
jgi:hypothetical protein